MFSSAVEQIAECLRGRHARQAGLGGLVRPHACRGIVVFAGFWFLLASLLLGRVSRRHAIGMISERDDRMPVEVIGVSLGQRSGYPETPEL